MERASHFLDKQQVWRWKVQRKDRLRGRRRGRGREKPTLRVIGSVKRRCYQKMRCSLTDSPGIPGIGSGAKTHGTERLGRTLLRQCLMSNKQLRVEWNN